MSIPALPQHERAAPHLASALRGETNLIVSGHALAEWYYSSLTTIPISPTITPGQARRLIEQNVANAAEEIVSLEGTGYLTVLQHMADLGLESGAVYDTLHVISAEKASADELRTFNGKDSRRLPPEGATDLVALDLPPPYTTRKANHAKK